MVITVGRKNLPNLEYKMVEGNKKLFNEKPFNLYGDEENKTERPCF